MICLSQSHQIPIHSLVNHQYWYWCYACAMNVKSPFNHHLWHIKYIKPRTLRWVNDFFFRPRHTSTPRAWFASVVKPSPWSLRSCAMAACTWPTTRRRWRQRGCGAFGGRLKNHGSRWFLVQEVWILAMGDSPKKIRVYWYKIGILVWNRYIGIWYLDTMCILVQARRKRN